MTLKKKQKPKHILYLFPSLSEVTLFSPWETQQLYLQLADSVHSLLTFVQLIKLLNLKLHATQKNLTYNTIDDTTEPKVTNLFWKYKQKVLWKNIGIESSQKNKYSYYYRQLKLASIISEVFVLNYFPPLLDALICTLKKTNTHTQHLSKRFYFTRLCLSQENWEICTELMTKLDLFMNKTNARLHRLLVD